MLAGFAFSSAEAAGPTKKFGAGVAFRNAMRTKTNALSAANLDA
jgi:hypothetical protein